MLYYHFESNEALEYAIIEETVAEITRDGWLRPLLRSKDKDANDALNRALYRRYELGQKA